MTWRPRFWWGRIPVLVPPGVRFDLALWEEQDTTRGDCDRCVLYMEVLRKSCSTRFAIIPVYRLQGVAQLALHPRPHLSWALRSTYEATTIGKDSQPRGWGALATFQPHQWGGGGRENRLKLKARDDGLHGEQVQVEGKGR